MQTFAFTGFGLSGISYSPCLLAARIAVDDLHRSKNATPSPQRPPLVLFLSGVPRVRCPSRRLCSHASHLCDYRSHWPDGITLGSKEPEPYFGVLYYKK